MKENDKYTVKLKKLNINSNDYKNVMNSTLSSQKEIIFTSSNLNKVFNKKVESRNEHGEHVQIVIKNIGSSDLKM